ncbi:MAG: AAA family ATPase [Ectothiorhodospiraceae bacterium]|nr:AAA family ATPase [Ectothiorhodospiraceae bacterium]
MYLEHFHLREHPFRLTPDFDFFFMSRSHARAKAYLDYTVVSRDGFAGITGEIGAGKTTLLNKLVKELDHSTILAHINQTQLNELEFLQAVVSAFGLDITGAGKVELINRLKTFLIRQAEMDKRVVLAVDEAQNLTRGVLEEIRMLSGIESSKTKLMSVILMGQPELEEIINAPDMEQLSQRVRLRFHLGPLNEQEIKDYVLHRLSVAGARSLDLFDDSAYTIIRYYAGGIPRLINTLCDMALLTAFVDDKGLVTDKTVQAAAKELAWVSFDERQSKLQKRVLPGHGPNKKANGAAAPQEASPQEVAEFSKAIQAAIGKMGSGFEGLQEQLKGIEKQLGEVVRQLEKRS